MRTFATGIAAFACTILLIAAQNAALTGHLIG
jgi:hypothetical protein